MTITAKVIADSISDGCPRITTIQLRYPRFIHSELMTHRVFSRNASSSRAIPVERLIQDVIDDTAMPIHWGANMPGMQAKEECNAPVQVPLGTFYVDPTNSANTAGLVMASSREDAWLKARDNAIASARAYAKAGYHKQIVNRLLEPFSHINVIVTATQWSNFLALRNHPDAQPEIHELAKSINNELSEHTPTILKQGEWHLPYVNSIDQAGLTQLQNSGDLKDDLTSLMIRISVARCARVSYLTHDKKIPKVEDDLKLYDRLLASVPLHASPAEHQATPDEISNNSLKGLEYKNMWLHGNFSGWIQYRKTLPNECQ